jgi:uncharacterized protein (TIGR02271 family)
MRQTVIGVFEYGVDAQMAAQQLMSQGWPADQVDVIVRGAHDKGAAIPGDRSHTDSDSRVGNFFKSLFSSQHDSDKYTRVAEHSSVVTVHARSEEEARRAAELLDQYGAVDVDERAERLGYAAPDQTNRPGEADTVRPGDRETTIPVIEENLHVGKRAVETGGVRMRSRIVERPVEEHMRLREEHVHVERKPADRPATEQDRTNFKEGEIEIVEHAEIPVVNKEARVVEEIEITKETSEHDETIRDTVRRQDVETKEIRPEGPPRDSNDPDHPSNR